jgi:hypothetical protein
VRRRAGSWQRPRGRQRLATAGAHTPAMPRAAPLVWPARLRGGGARRQRLGPGLIGAPVAVISRTSKLPLGPAADAGRV